MTMIYQQCTFCVMDTTDPGICFEANGRCNRCRTAEQDGKNIWFPNEEGKRRLDALIAQAKQAGYRHDYDCIIGISGGIDSAYLAYRLRKDYPDLRILAIHVDGGWNSEISVRNIESLVKQLSMDLHTEVIDWKEMRDLQLAFMRASVPNQDIPQDHAFFAALYHLANQHGIRYFFSGGNFATESILPSEWGHAAMDPRHLRAIHRQFGTLPKLRRFPIISLFDWYLWYPYVRRFVVARPLNLMPYDKTEAKQLLKSQLGWADYGEKHHESRFTKFFQSYYLPTKFGWDKRKAHLSSMIVSRQLCRDEALAVLARPPYDVACLDDDILFLSKKLGISVDDLRGIIAATPIPHSAYPTSQAIYDLKNRIKRWLHW
jgi:N-acetyl sugar amidotransferase